MKALASLDAPAVSGRVHFAAVHKSFQSNYNLFPQQLSLRIVKYDGKCPGIGKGAG